MDSRGRVVVPVRMTREQRDQLEAAYKASTAKSRSEFILSLLPVTQ